MSEISASSQGSARREEPADEKALIARCKAGDKTAFDDLIRRYERRIYNFAYRLCGNHEEAGDIAADTFVRVYTSLANFRGESSFLTWLFRVITNIYLDERKRQRARPKQSLDELIELDENSLVRQIEDRSPTPEERLEATERTEILQRAILQLPEFQRVMVVLYHTENRSYEEIAELLDLPIGTVKSRLNRARLTLRQILEPDREHFRR
jgi:RNA polymerase sigma-70 factor (ECF subfamily)